jgi:predicted secreted protein
MYKLIVALLPVFISCSGAIQNKTNEPMQNNLTGKPADQEKISVRVDSVFSIKLQCSVGAGFSWQLTDSGFTNLQYLGQDFANMPTDKDGQDGIQAFHFKALKAGDDAVRFVYVQPFIKPRPADAKLKDFVIQISNQ